MHQEVHASARCLPGAVQAREAVCHSVHALQQGTLEVKAVQIGCHRLSAQVDEYLHQHCDHPCGICDQACKLAKACELLHPSCHHQHSHDLQEGTLGIKSVQVGCHRLLTQVYECLQHRCKAT